MTRLLSRLVVGAASVAVALVGTLVAAPSATAANTWQFDPGHIITDAIFFDRNTMSPAAVQTFLTTAGSACVPAADGTPCLKDYRQSTTSRPADARCAAYTGAGNEAASTIIAKVAVACGINPQVLLVTLQKEQSLVTRRTAGTAAVYQKAMGMGCPDTAACDAQYYGFYNQVYSAASQFKKYTNSPNSYTHRPGRTIDVRFHPNAACGSSPVYIQNQATANLYNYTPYQPNAAAIAAGYGTGDACSAYGNRNFWNYFTDWFGSPTGNRVPFGNFELISSTFDSISVRGWAMDPDTSAPVDIHLYVNGAWGGSIRADVARADIAAAYPGNGTQHGFAFRFPAAAGTSSVCAYAIDTAGGANTPLGCRSVNVVNTYPVANFEQLTANGTAVTLSGWAVDPDTAGPIDVHFYVNGAWGGSVSTTGVRSDVARAYPGTGDQHGFTRTFTAGPGTHQVCTYAIDTTNANNTPMGCRTVTVAAPVNRLPLANFEQLTANGTAVTLGGWAVDPDTAGPIDVHFYVNGAWGGSVRTDLVRSDVARAYPGTGDQHGFTRTFTAGPGSHQICTYAIDTTTKANTPMGCRTVTVTAPVAPAAPVVPVVPVVPVEPAPTTPTPTPAANTPPLGNFESLTASGTTVSLGGWALDPDTAGAIDVHFYVNGGWGGSVRTDLVRSDVSRAYPGTGDQHGFARSFTAGPGTHEVCTYAIDTTSASNTPMGCRTVTVG
ncbi:hypothetical protein [Cellulomonas cellasea]|uniref:Hemagglutinin n=2 Tax=Cellulomonas cellasea TaxID=43670 RepID=A0A0A0B3U2_9CELL|nr:hypothetical protein [Cellulomonas cellasea]KGM00853.1 hypothetical protein Q760_05565 [Cellulomonas cellasea DSM 20118]GEA88657.1 hypothetical protein CCE01nite_26060 [Cellulomonas cellasea]